MGNGIRIRRQAGSPSVSASLLPGLSEHARSLQSQRPGIFPWIAAARASFADANVEAQTTQASRDRPHDIHRAILREMLRAEPALAVTAARHRVLVAFVRAANGGALRGDHRWRGSGWSKHGASPFASPRRGRPPARCHPANETCSCGVFDDRMMQKRRQSRRWQTADVRMADRRTSAHGGSGSQGSKEPAAKAASKGLRPRSPPARADQGEAPAEQQA